LRARPAALGVSVGEQQSHYCATEQNKTDRAHAVLPVHLISLPLKSARLLEPFAMVWIDQAMTRGRGRDFAFALVNAR
jgi:hypothetical protein